MISNKISYILIFLISVVFLTSVSINAKGDKKNKTQGMSKTTAEQIANTYININNLSTLVSNVGFGDYNLNPNLEGTIYPKGSGKTCIFETGFVWGAFVTGDTIPHMGGSTYSTGLTPGPIMADGQPAADPNSSNYRIFRVRPDVYPGGPAVDLSSDAANESLQLPNVTEASIRAQYELDWNEWPAAGTANDLGAPFEDKNGDGIYEPSIDVPGVPGADQTVFWVANDMNKNTVNALYGTDPLGIEVRGTYWAYAQSGALGNMYFKKYTIINKGYQKYTLDSMFVSWWADIDNGDAGDDYTGNDTTLSLTYCYNADAVDNVYKPLPPPAVGADFFQGPIVPGEPTDSAIFNGRIVHGKKNLPMTAAYYFINSDPVLVDPQLGGDPTSSLQFYRLMNGELPLSGQPYTNPVTNQSTKFVLTGDPVTRTGWIDGMLFPKGDRRQGMASGPFTMAPGDTQEVVVAEIVAGATPNVDRLSAIGLLKFYDQTAQSAYNNFFDLPTPPKPPQVQVTALNNKIVLNWGGNEAAVKATEQAEIKGYKFQGYNVYQLPNRSASLSEAARIATYDLTDGILKIYDDYFDPTSGVVLNHVVQFGSDNGIKRYITITSDAFNSNQPLVNGIKYYFAVTAYSYNADEIPHALENPIAIIGGSNGIVPQSPDPGVTYLEQPGDTLKTTHSSGVSDGSVTPIVVDPSKLTGDNYKVNFYVDTDTNSATLGETLWRLQNGSGNVLLSNQTQYLPGSSTSDAPIIDGLQMIVQGPPLEGLDWDYTGPRWLSGAPGSDGELMFGGAYLGPNFLGSSVAPPDYVNLQIDVYKVESYTDVNGNGSYDVGEPYVVNPDSGQIANLYTTWGAGNWETTALVPFKVYDVTSDPPRQLDVIVRDRDGNGQWDSNDGENILYNYVFIMNTTYDPTGNDWNPTAGGQDFMEHALDGTEPIQWAFWWGPRGNLEQMAESFSMTFIAPKVNTATDEFTFTAPAPAQSDAQAKIDVQQINVFPNPYYGVNTQEINKYARFVTFNHLPQKATIRIFNLAGILVRTIEHSGTQFERWDLNNKDGYLVGSGLYIAYIDMPSLGTTKILKFAIIQEQQVLDRY